MNTSAVLRAVEWVDQAAKEGDRFLMERAKMALEGELASRRVNSSPARAYANAVESFVRKHGREPLEDLDFPDEA